MRGPEPKKPFFPPQPERFDLTTPERFETLGPDAAHRLAKSSSLFLEWLKWPAELELSFAKSRPMENWQYGSREPLLVPHNSTLHLRASNLEPGAALYEFDLQVATDGRAGIVDAAIYKVTRPEYQDYIMPWVLSVQSLSRVLFPRRRTHVPANLLKYQTLNASAAVTGIADTLNGIRRGQYGDMVAAYKLDGRFFADTTLRTTYVES